MQSVAKVVLSFLSLGIMFSPVVSLAHSEPTGNEPSVEQYVNVLEKLGHLNIQSGVDKESMNASAKVSFVPFFNVGGERVQIDNAFWDLADELTRLYVQEIKQSCEDCKMPSIEEVRREAEALVAKGWFKSKAEGLKDAILYRYVGEYVGLGARYGTAAGVAKVAGELMEDALLVVFKMPGAHFLCEAITFAIAYYSGATLTFTRALFYSKYFNRGRISTLVRLAVTSHYIKRSLNRLVIDVPAFSINEELLREFKEETSERKLTYRITGRHRVEAFLKALEADIVKRQQHIDKLNANTEKLSARQQKELLVVANEGLKTTETIYKKVFDGYRYKRFFLLKKRNSSTTLHHYAENTSPLLRGTNFWFFELKNEIFEPNVKLEAEKDFRKDSERWLRVSQLQNDSITRLQLEGLDGERAREVASHIFDTLDRIGDKKLKTSERYFNVTFVEAFYGSLLPKLMGEIVKGLVEQTDPNDKRFRDVLYLQWKAGRLSYFTDVFVDYVRFSAFDTKNADPTRKYHIRDYALNVMKVFGEFSQFENAKTSAELRAGGDYLDEKIKELDANRFWLQKDRKPRLIPFLGGGITCEALYL